MDDDEQITRQQLNQLINQLRPDHVATLARIAIALIELGQPPLRVLNSVPDQPNHADL